MVAPAASAEPRLPTMPVGTFDYTVNVNKPDGSAARVFYTTGQAAAVPFVINQPGLDQIGQANIIADKSGKIVYRYTPPRGQSVANFRTQIYQGRKVLTWWQGTGAAGHGAGVDYIADINGHVIKTVTPGDGLHSDVHEFRLTPDGRALITSYVPVKADLTSVGGPRDGVMLDCVAAVVDVATNRVLTHWSALEHIPVAASSSRPNGLGDIVRGSEYDPYHMNSIALGSDGDLLISFRNLNAIYDVDMATGKIRWRLGGKHPDFAMGPGTSMFGQHDAEFADASTVRFFDNNIDVYNQQGESAIKWIRIDPRKHTAILVRAQHHPADIASAAMGNAQALPRGFTAGSWGMAPHISEFSPTGKLVYDATLPVGTYRAYMDTWP
ncbi:arylsulfotransferase family protein [Gordonia rhizosphera]|uniref:arylsulfotransferase family protein n=1 Tax=Gordonia rhizosphera TaxID=83341 RepID=UPI001FDFABDD|nr:arylsulfotransferase family protein [Gordonia rhizosphera]